MNWLQTALSVHQPLVEGCMKPSLLVIYSLKPFLHAFILNADFFLNFLNLAYVCTDAYSENHFSYRLCWSKYLWWAPVAVICQHDFNSAWHVLLLSAAPQGSVSVVLCLCLIHLISLWSQEGVPAVVWSSAIKACPQTAHLPGYRCWPAPTRDQLPGCLQPRLTQTHGRRRTRDQHTRTDRESTLTQDREQHETRGEWDDRSEEKEIKSDSELMWQNYQQRAKFQIMISRMRTNWRLSYNQQEINV